MHKKVTAYLKKNPDASVQEALDQTQSNSGAYYTQKRAAIGTTRKPKFKKLLPTAEAANGSTKFVVVVNAEQLQRVLGAL